MADAMARSSALNAEGEYTDRAVKVCGEEL